MTQPPRIATWMLKHLGSGPDNDMLLGDLAEQYQQDGNAMWYWRQALKAIPVSLCKEIRAHKWISARALLIGWAVWMAFGGVIPLHVPLEFFFSHRDLGDLVVNHTLLPFLVGILCGGLVAHFHRNQRTAVILLFATSFLLLYLLVFWKILFELPSVYAKFAAMVGAAFLGILLGGGLLFGKANNVAVED